jgi:hypothetical protein
MLGNTKFNPSFIEDEIYGMMDDYMIGMDTYNEGLVSAVTDFFTNYNPGVEWNLGCSEWLDCSGGVCYVSWIENGHLHMIGFDYKKEGFCNE